MYVVLYRVYCSLIGRWLSKSGGQRFTNGSIIGETWRTHACPVSQWTTGEYVWFASSYCRRNKLDKSSSGTIRAFALKTTRCWSVLSNDMKSTFILFYVCPTSPISQILQQWWMAIIRVIQYIIILLQNYWFLQYSYIQNFYLQNWDGCSFIFSVIKTISLNLPKGNQTIDCEVYAYRLSCYEIILHKVVL